MAGQRLIHPEQSRSRKVSALSDLEYRVWEQTKLTADDFGVLLRSPLGLRHDNKRLSKVPERAVTEALDALVKAELLLSFEHQDELYLCAPVWQTWQKVKYPRRTHCPKPPAAVLARCDDETQHLFSIHPGGVKLKKRAAVSEDSGDDDGGFPENSGKDAGEVRDLSGAHQADTPANAHANANANAVLDLEGGAGETAARGREGVAQRARALGIVPPGTWDRQHATHALRRELCGWHCLPQAVHDSFVNLLVGAGSTTADATTAVRAWALDVQARWAGRIPGDDNFRFWRHEWQRTHGSNRPSAAPRPAAGLDAIVQAGKAAGRG